MRLAFSTCQAKMFGGRNFRDLAFDRENRENFYPAKISHYTVFTIMTEANLTFVAFLPVSQTGVLSS